MHFLTAFLLASLPITLAAGSDGQQSRLFHRRQARNVQKRNDRVFKMTDIYQGKNFFDGWDFFDAPDPTHGRVNFLKREDAFSKKLAYVQDDNTTVVAVDDYTPLPVGTNRNSVRIQSKKTFTGGLFIADFFAMPHGCSVWPAWWSVGPNWPQGGEIDVLEGVHNQPTNQMTLHTAEGCTLQDVSKSPATKNKVLFTSDVLTTQCASSGSNNMGCAFSEKDSRTYGHGFNINDGGVLAHLWDDSGIKVWNFPRNEVPADINSRNPNPASWPAPAAFWSSATCNMGSHFFDHTLVLDTTLCGDWAEGVYGSSGCPGTCAEAVADPKNFKLAKWMINYIAVYN